MLIAAIEELPQKISPAMVAFGVVVLVLAAVAVYVFWRLVKRIETNGPQVRHDLVSSSEMIAGTTVLILYAWLALNLHFPAVYDTSPLPSKLSHEMQYAETPVPPALKEGLLHSMILNALPAAVIIGAMLLRGARVRDQFGLVKAGPGRTLGLGVGLGLLALALGTFVHFVVVQWMQWNSQSEAPQPLVRHFLSAAAGGEIEVMLLIGFSAVVVAPLIEEILFRGTFYPILARGLGRIPAALIGGLLFALVHPTYAAVPGLMLFAVVLTLAYEATGSLAVPIVMHMTFNGLSLIGLWWASKMGLG